MKQYAAPNQMQLDGSTQQETVIRNAIDRVRLAHDSARGEKLYVAFSGGKDSTVLYDVVKKAAEKDKTPISEYCDLVYNVTGVDPPELVYFMRRNYPELQWSMYEKSMWRLIEAKGVPTRLQRFCCASLKERGGMGRMCCTGIRWAESVKRSKRGAYENFVNDKKNKILLNDNDEARLMFESCVPQQKRICNPIIDFTDANVWDYIRGNKLSYCELYDEGFDRLGCIGCPMAGDKRNHEFERYPKFKANYIRAFDRMLVRGKSRGKVYADNWATGQDVFDWWMQDKNMDKPIDGQMEWEDL